MYRIHQIKLKLGEKTHILPEKILKKVEKPARYTGGEWGQTIKDKSKINFNNSAAGYSCGRMYYVMGD